MLHSYLPLLRSVLVCLGLVMQTNGLVAQSLRPQEGQTTSPAPAAATPSQPGFVLVHHPAMMNRFQTNAKAIQAALEKGILSWTGASSLPEAWSSLVSPTDRIGIRINTSGGAITSTHLPDSLLHR